MSMMIPTCLLCGSRWIETVDGICSRCLAALHEMLYDTTAHARCGACCRQLLHQDQVCPCTSSQDAPFKQYVLGPYRGMLKHLILAYKFKPQRRLARCLARLTLPVAGYLAGGAGKAVLVPVPCSKAGLRLRGWDQMAVLADRMADGEAVVVHRLIKRQGKGQMKLLDRVRRKEVAREAYSLDERACRAYERDQIFGQSPLIILDDVKTSGSTLKACAGLLSERYCVPVAALCLAED